MTKEKRAMRGFAMAARDFCEHGATYADVLGDGDNAVQEFERDRALLQRELERALREWKALEGWNGLHRGRCILRRKKFRTGGA